MFKKETQKRFFKFLERELITVLAVSIIGVSALFTQAATNGTFSIGLTVTEADGGGGGGGGSVILSYPTINNVSPVPVINNADHVLDIYGFNFSPSVSFKLDAVPLENVRRLSEVHAKATVPAGFAIGQWNLWVFNNDDTSGIWGNRVRVIHVVVPDEDVDSGDGTDDEELDEDIIDGIYSAKWVAQSPYPTLEIGETITLWVDFENIGTLPWHPNGGNPVRLGTSRERDRVSRFSTDRWLNGNRAATISGVVQPGEIGRFTFDITAPRTLSLGSQREYFQPVVEYVEWLEDYGVYWDINVTGRPGLINDLLNITPKVEALTPVVVEPTPEQKTDEDLFVDPFELFFGSFRSLFGGIGSWFDGWF